MLRPYSFSFIRTFLNKRPHPRELQHRTTGDASRRVSWEDQGDALDRTSLERIFPRLLGSLAGKFIPHTLFPTVLSFCKLPKTCFVYIAFPLGCRVLSAFSGAFTCLFVFLRTHSTSRILEDQVEDVPRSLGALSISSDCHVWTSSGDHIHQCRNDGCACHCCCRCTCLRTLRPRPRKAGPTTKQGKQKHACLRSVRRRM